MKSKSFWFSGVLMTVLAAGVATERWAAGEEKEQSNPAGSSQSLQDYARPEANAKLPPAMASLYETPWRARVRTESAAKALDGIGVYYKHVPAWGVEGHTAVMREMREAGVRRLRFAIVHPMYITADWKEPKPEEMKELRDAFRAARAAGMRPCMTFVHVPPMGTPDTDELQKWWHYDQDSKTGEWKEVAWNGPLMPVGAMGSAKYKAYLDKTYEALKFILDEGRAAGFGETDSWDLEMGQNLWWGAPARSKPLPGVDLSSLQPGGLIYEFDSALIDRLRKDGYREPTIWLSQSHHVFDQMSDAELPESVHGRAISFYTQGIGVKSSEWTKGSADTWPVRPEPELVEGTPPEMVLARPEGWFADRSRHENLMDVLDTTKKPLAILALGTVPGVVPDWKAGGLTGWQIKERAIGREMAFWMNQGADFVMWHSAFEGGADNGEADFAVLPSDMNPLTFRFGDSKPLATLRAFTKALDAAQPIKTLRPLSFRFALATDPVLIDASSQSPRQLKASDAVVLLPFQIDEKTYAVAAYVMTPNVTRPLPPVQMTLKIDQNLLDPGVTLLHPSSGTKRMIPVSKGDPSTVEFELTDDVMWLRFKVE